MNKIYEMSPEHVVLDYVTEDLTTVDEITSAFKHKYPNRDNEEVQSFVRDLLIKLQGLGLIDVYLVDATAHTEVRLDEAQAISIFNIPDSLSTSTSSINYLMFSATDKGKEMYYKNPKFQSVFK